MGKGILFPGIKLQESKTDHTLPSSDEIKRVWSYTSATHYACKRNTVLY